MKSQLILKIIAVLLVPILISGCNRTGKQSKSVASGVKEISGQEGVSDTLKVEKQIIEIIQNSPKPVEIVDLLNEVGASYIIDLTVPVADVEKMMTSNKKAIGIGLYAFDAKYASIYNRVDIFLNIKDNINRLVADLGIRESMSGAEKYYERIEKNKTNTDSVRFYVEQVYKNFHQYMQKGEYADIYALSFIGANIEALDVLTQTALLAKNNEKLLTIMSQQNERIKSLSSLLEAMSVRENVKPYYEQIQPIIKFFKSKVTITNADLNEIAPLITKARISMIQS